MMMKKAMILIATAIVCLSAIAQVQFGFKVGVDATNYWGKKGFPEPVSYPWIVDHGMRLNYQAGLVMEYKFSPKFAIAPEVVFAAQGGKYRLDNPTLPSNLREVSYNTNYINVPLMLKYYVSPAFSIDLGPQAGFNVYSRMKLNDETSNSKSRTKSVDFGIGLGATYNLTENAFVQTRYTMGLTKVFKDDYMNAKNGNIQLAFGMKF